MPYSVTVAYTASIDPLQNIRIRVPEARYQWQRVSRARRLRTRTSGERRRRVPHEDDGRTESHVDDVIEIEATPDVTSSLSSHVCTDIVIH